MEAYSIPGAQEDVILAKIDAERGFTDLSHVTSPLQHAERKPFGVELQVDGAVLSQVIDACVAIMIEPNPKSERAVDRATKAYVVARIIRACDGPAEISIEGAQALYRQMFAMAGDGTDSPVYITANNIRDTVLRRSR